MPPVAHFEKLLFCSGGLNHYDKMDQSIRKTVICSVKYRYAIPLKFGEKLLTFLTKLVLEGKASICSTIKENPLLS